MLHRQVAWASAGVWAAVVAVLGLTSAAQAATVPLAATVVDRQGNTYHVERLTFNGREDLEYFVAGKRHVVPIRELSRLRFEGEPGQEEQPVTITWPSGRGETGLMPTGASVAAHDDASGGGGSAMRFAGATAMGPFYIMVSDVREVVMTDVRAAVPEPPVLRAALITEEGRRFDLSKVQYRGGQRLTYWVGQRRRFVDLSKVAQIDFAEGSANEEQRPITIALWTGKTLQGTVEAGRVRLSGETDSIYHDRVTAAWTGSTQLGGFAVGMHAVRQVRFKAPGEEEGTGEPAPQIEPEAGDQSSGANAVPVVGCPFQTGGQTQPAAAADSTKTTDDQSGGANPAPAAR